MRADILQAALDLEMELCWELSGGSHCASSFRGPLRGCLSPKTPPGFCLCGWCSKSTGDLER